MKKIFLIFLLIITGVFSKVFSQVIANDSIHFSGIVLSADSLKPLQAHYQINNQQVYMVEANGKFSFWVKKKDMIQFSFLGYKNYLFVVSDTLKMKEYVIGILLKTDTILMEQVYIYPKISKNYLKYDMLSMKNDKNTQNAQNNLNLASYQAQTGSDMNQKWDAEMNQRHLSQKQQVNAGYMGMQNPDKFIKISMLIPFGIFLYTKVLNPKDNPAFHITEYDETQIRNYFKKSEKIKIKLN